MKRRLPAIGVLCVVLGATLLCGWLAVSLHRTREEVRVWRQAHSAEKVVGMTADEVVSQLGEPYASERGSDGSIRFLMFKGPQGHYLGIAFDEGVASKASYAVQ